MGLISNINLKEHPLTELSFDKGDPSSGNLVKRFMLWLMERRYYYSQDMMYYIIKNEQTAEGAHLGGDFELPHKQVGAPGQGGHR
jgi:hypothetical protein